MLPLHRLLFCLWFIVVDPGFIDSDETCNKLAGVLLKEPEILPGHRAPDVLLFRRQQSRHPPSRHLPHPQHALDDVFNSFSRNTKVSAIKLTETRRSCITRFDTLSTFSAVVTVSGLPVRLSSSTALKPNRNLCDHFATVEYEGDSFPNVFSKSTWISDALRPFLCKYSMTARVLIFSIFSILQK